VVPLDPNRVTRSSTGRVLEAVELSLRLSIAQAPAIHAAAKLRAGALVWATATSAQEYGYIMSTGGECRGI
jgi:hypothetical protein